MTPAVYRRSLSMLVALLLLVPAAPAAIRAVRPPVDGSVVSSSGRVLPPLPDELSGPSIHAQMLESAGSVAPRFEVGGEPSISLADGAGTFTPSSLPNGLRKEVFGFLPYWMLTDSALANLNYSLLSTIAYFSVGANKHGQLIKGSASSPSTGWAGWTSSRMTQVLDRAHASGVRVVLTVTMMAWNSTSAANQATLLTSASNRSQLVQQIVDAVGARGADGVNLDFEPLATSLRAPYVTFVRELKAGLKAAGVGDYLTVSVMASSATWATGYDVPGLTAAGAADALFVMGYDYHWSGSSRAGGVAPIESPYTIDVNGTMLDFLAETSPSKLIWGVPYYGRTWPTSSKRLNATTLGGGSKAYYYTGSRAQAAQHGRRWDDVGKVPWYRFWDGAGGNWVQGYYDDVASLGTKYDLINARGLAGTGMWTLLMDQGRDELWRLLADKFVKDTTPPVGGIRLLPSSVDAQAVRVRWRALDYASGVRSYDVQVRPSGGTWTMWLTGTSANGAWFAGDAGRTYTFRVRAVDWKGNRQPWTSTPATPTSVSPETFAKVVVPTLNIRSGPGLGFGVVTTASQGDVVYVTGGPTNADGYSWFRVQYGFSEWPSADYPRLGWMAVGSGGTTYLAPRSAPNRTKFRPFVAAHEAADRFSPNGDGRRDGAAVSYRLRDAASGVRLVVVDSDGSTVRRVDLGAQPAGERSATWDGRLGGGAWAPEGKYLLKVVAEAADGTHVGPSGAVNAVILDRFGTIADTTAPSLLSASPSAGSEMVSAGSRLVLRFSERVRRIGPDHVQLQLEDGTPIPADNARRNAREIVVKTTAPLPAAATLRAWIAGVRDAVGNALVTVEWTFQTAPGQGLVPRKRVRLASGTHVGYRIGASGELLGARKVRYGSVRHAEVDHRGRLPNLPGRWLHVATGGLRGWWLRESPAQRLSGETESKRYPSSTRAALAAGTHTGYRFDSNGQVTATRRATLYASTSADIGRRAIINGRAYLRIISGRWAGYWMRESSGVHIRGRIGRIGMPALPRLSFAAGTYTGYRYSSSGRVRSKLTATLPSASVATADAWAIINGQPHYRIHNGTWAGLWVPESGGIALTP